MRVIGYASLAALLLVALAFSPPVANASHPSTDYAIGIRDGTASVSLTLSLLQNFTVLQSSFSLPAISGVLAGSDASNATLAVQQALNSKSQSAHVSNLVMSVAVSNWSNLTSIQWFNLTMKYDVTGVYTSRFGGEQADLSWKSFVVGSDLLIGGVEVNNLGPNYIGLPAEQIASQQVSSTFVQVSYRVNAKTSTPELFLAAAKSFDVLNFSRLSPPISSWSKAYDFSSNSLVWTLNAGSSLGMSIAKTFNEPGAQPGGLAIVNYGLFYSLESQINAPRRSIAEGDTITTTFDDFPQTIMASVVIGVSSVGIGAVVLEKRVSNKIPKSRKR